MGAWVTLAVGPPPLPASGVDVDPVPLPEPDPELDRGVEEGVLVGVFVGSIVRVGTKIVGVEVGCGVGGR